MEQEQMQEAPQVEEQPQEQPQAEPQEQEVAQEQPQQEVQPEAQPQTQQVQEEAPVQAPLQDSEQEDDVDDFNYGFPEVPQAQPIDLAQLPTDADGNIDINTLNQAIAYNQQQMMLAATQQATQAVEERFREQKLWDQATKAYPELASDKEMRNLVHNARLGEMTMSLGKKNPTPKQIADKLFGRITTAKQAGVTQAQQNVRIQESAALDTASTRSNVDNRSTLQQRMNSGSVADRDAARREYLASLVDNGDIQILG